MSTRELAAAWGCSADRIARWCRLDLLPATKTTRGWIIERSARRPWMDSGMLLAWLARQR